MAAGTSVRGSAPTMTSVVQRGARDAMARERLLAWASLRRRFAATRLRVRNRVAGPCGRTSDRLKKQLLADALR